MRRVLVDAARTRASLKRGGHRVRVNHSTAIDFYQFPTVQSNRAAELCELDDALNTLLRIIDARRPQVIELRYFGALSCRRDCRRINYRSRSFPSGSSASSSPTIREKTMALVGNVKSPVQATPCWFISN
jgi:ECF sigma factor